MLLAATAGVYLAARGLGHSGFRWDLFRATLSAIHPGWMSAAFVFVMLSYVGRAVRWRVMMAPVRAQVRLAGLISATVVGFTAVVFFGRPGEFVRPWLIANRERVPLSSQIAAWVLERVFDLLGVILLFGFALIRVGRSDVITPRMAPIVHAGGYIALGIGIACAGFLFVSARFTSVARRWSGLLSQWLPVRIRALVDRSLESFLDVTRSAGTAGSLISIGLWTAAEWAVICTGIYFLFRSFGPTSGFSVADALTFSGFVAFGGAVQLPGIGGGMQVAAVLVLTEVFGLALEKATACALLVWVLTWLSVVPFGVLLAFHEGLQWSNLRNIQKTATETVGARDPANPVEHR